MVIDEGMLGSGERILDFWVEDFQRSSSLIYGEDGSGDGASAESPSSGEEEFISNLGSLSITVTGYSEDLYRYIKSLEAYSEFGGFNEIFGEPVCIHNNIENGIGCFGAIARRTLE